MGAIQIVGPSYNLQTRKADCQRSVNLYPAIMEAPGGKAAAILKPVPGLTLFSTLGTSAVRGCKEKDGRAFAVCGATFYEIFADGTSIARGTVSAGTTPVEITFNINQVGIVDGTGGWYFDLSMSVLTPIYTPGFYGTPRLANIDGYGIAVRLGTGQFYISAIDDFSQWNPLDFATAEGSPDNLLTVVASHREAWLGGSKTTEVWDDAGTADFPFERIGSAFIEHGTTGPYSAQALDNTVFWLGEDGIVWRANGYSPLRISTHAIEEAIGTSTNLAGATAFAYQQDGHTFYCLNIPGLLTTLVYDVASQSWHERAELVDGAYQQHRATCHMFAFGKHLVGCSDGTLCEFDRQANTNNGDVLVRDRISPHLATPTYDMQPFSALQIDCNVGDGLPTGQAPLLMMRYSDDGGFAWKNWRTVSLGTVGQRRARAIFRRLGEARDRVWQIRCTENVPFSIIGAAVR
jgi:hypothetical protein